MVLKGYHDRLLTRLRGVLGRRSGGELGLPDVALRSEPGEDPRVTAARAEFARMREQMSQTLEMLAAREAQTAGGALMRDGEPARDGQDAPARGPDAARTVRPLPRDTARAIRRLSAADASTEMMQRTDSGSDVREAEASPLPALPVALAVALLGAAAALLRAETPPPDEEALASHPTGDDAWSADTHAAPTRAAAMTRRSVDDAGAPEPRAGAVLAEADLVAQMQDLLSAMDYGPGVVTGEIGPLTRVAMDDFAAAFGLDAPAATPAFVARLRQAERDGHVALASRNNPGLARVNAVRVAQRLLNDMGYEAGPADGDAGARTMAAAEAFALDMAVSFADFDRAFAAALRRALEDGHQAPDPQMVALIGEIQMHLVQMGYLDGPIDGVADAGTRAAATAFARAHDVRSAEPDGALLAALRAVAAREAAEPY